MEWVEITGATVEEARERLLDRLGVDASDAEIEVVDEPGKAMFGLRRTDARVRARVRPTAPPPRQERNDRRKNSTRSKSQSPQRNGPKRSSGQNKAKAASSGAGAGSSRSGAGRGNRKGANKADSGKPGTKAENSRSRRATGSKNSKQEKAMTEDTSLDDQGAMIVEFLDGLVEAFDLPGKAEIVSTDNDAVEVAVNGDGLGLLIGPAGNTLSALGEVTKTVLQRRTGGSSRARVRLDVAGYRERRRTALAAFTLEVVAAVKESGESRALEPMHSADRKVVHDTVSDVEGVGTISDGDEPRRRVVLVPQT